MKRFLISVVLSAKLYGQSPHPVADAAFQPHCVAEFEVDFSTTIMADIGMLGEHAKGANASGKLKGCVQIICNEMTDAEYDFYYRFKTIKQLDLPVAEEVLLSVRNDLSKGLRFLQKKDGQITELCFPEKPSEAGESLLVQLLEYYQCVRPGKAAATWQAPLQIADGNMEAGYTSAIKGNTRVLQLLSLEPVEDMRPQQVVTKHNVYKPTLSYEWQGNNAWFNRLTGSVERVTKINQSTLMARRDSLEMKLVMAGTNKDQFAAGEMTDKSIYSRPIYYPEKDVAYARERDLQKASELNIPDLLEELRRNETLKDELIKDRLTTSIRLCLVAEKASLPLIRNVFFESDVHGFSYKTIRAALVTASTPFAQETLCSYIATNYQDWSKLKRIIPSVGLIRNAMPKVEQQLEQLAFDSANSEDLRSAAQLALGNIAGNLRHHDQVRADSVASKLAHSLRNSDDAIQVMSVLGNCGTSNTLPYILPYTKDTDALVRGQAYYALRFVNEPTVEEMFKLALREQNDSPVLEQVLNALYFRKFNRDIYVLVDQVVQRHPTEKTRLQALQLIFGWSYRHSGLAQDIAEHAEKNSMTAVREAAAQFIYKKK